MAPGDQADLTAFGAGADAAAAEAAAGDDGCPHGAAAHRIRPAPSRRHLSDRDAWAGKERVWCRECRSVVARLPA